MARQSSRLVDQALRSVASPVACDGDGVWRFALVNGEVLPVRARVTDGWLELTAPVAEWARPDFSDLLGLHVNSHLSGSSRVARLFGERRPHVRADACIEQVPDLVEWVRAAGEGLTGACHLVARWRDGLSLPSVASPAPAASAAAVERACRDAGWRTAGNEGSSLHVDISTRAGAYTARLESSPQIAERFVIELTDLTGQPDVCRRAVAALLLAVSGSVRLVKGGIVDRDGATRAALMSALDRPTGRSIDDALSALAVACCVCGREAQALVDERLALEYLALSGGAREGESHSSLEDQPCLQER